MKTTESHTSIQAVQDISQGIPSSGMTATMNDRKHIGTRDGVVFNSPRVKDMEKPPSADIKFNLGPKINILEATDIMNKRGPGQRKTVADLFNNQSQRRSNFTSMVENKTVAGKADQTSLNQFRASVADLKTEVSIPKKASPWRVFSFDKRNKADQGQSQSGLSTMIAPIKSRPRFYAEPIEINFKSDKHDSQIFQKKRSFSNLTIKPNYYMKSLEYYFMLERNDYFSKLYKEHFQLAFNSIKFVKIINKATSDNFAEKNCLNLKKKMFYKGRSLSTQTKRLSFLTWTKLWCTVPKVWTWETITLLLTCQTALISR